LPSVLYGFNPGGYLGFSRIPNRANIPNRLLHYGFGVINNWGKEKNQWLQSNICIYFNQYMSGFAGILTGQISIKPGQMPFFRGRLQLGLDSHIAKPVIFV